MKRLNFFSSFLIILCLSVQSHVTFAGSTSDNSFYDYQATLTDQDGKKVTLDTFKGHPVVVSMFYASCDYACPLLIDVIKKMEAKINPATKDKVRILLISFDPKNDTPSALKKLAIRHNVDLTHWKFVSPAEKSVRDIAALLGFVYRPLPQGGFNHTSSLTLLDETGNILHTEEGFQNAADAIVKILNKK